MIGKSVSIKNATFSSMGGINYNNFNNFESPTSSSFATCKDNERNIDPVENSSISLTIFNENMKFKMLTNYVKLLLIINFIPLIGYCFSIIYYKWYLVEFQNDKFWVNLLYIYDEQNNEYYEIQGFIDSVCWDYLQRNPEMSCGFFNIFKTTGGVTFFFMAIASVMHIFHIFQLIIILLKKYQLLQLWFCIKLKTLQVSAFILYIGGIFIWVFFILLSQRTFKNYGISFYVALISTCFYSGVFIYFVRLKKILKEKKLINNLLNPDELLRRNSSK